VSLIHELSDVSSSLVGEGTRIWQFSVVLEGARLGKNCNICAHVFIEGDVVIGNNVVIKSGVQVWDGTRIGDNVFVGPNVTFTNDPFPRAQLKPEEYNGVTLEEYVSIGANATLLPGITVGAHAMVGAGAVVTKDVLPRTLVIGNPAKFIRSI
jgi:UDP-2-acetamido-3-amino-2,3-dideoxy-glucuronate N-acetyltransferase